MRIPQNSAGEEQSLNGWRRAYRENPTLFHRFACAEDPQSVAWKSLLEHADFAGRRVLEIGCGTGRFTQLISRQSKCSVFTACDCEPAMLNFAKQNGSSLEIDYLLADAEQLPVADSSFDRVFASWVLGFMGQKKRSQILAEIKRVLGVGGELWTFEELEFAKSNNTYATEIVAEIKTEYAFESREAAQTTCDFLMGEEAPQFVSARAPHHVALLMKKF